MELLKEVFELTFGYFNDLGKRIHWFYILTSLILAYYVWLKTLKRKKKIGFLAYFFKKENYLSKSAIIDYSFLVFNAFIKILVISSFAFWSKRQQFFISEWLLENFGYQSNHLNIGLLVAFYTAALLVLGDFSYYLLHWAYHKIPFLWAFHKVHHASTAMNPITQYRIHPIELILNNGRYILVITLLNGVFDYLSSGYFGPSTYLGVSVVLLTFNAWGANLRHSHIKLTYFSWLENWLISPFQHQIHHSSQKHLYDKNLGSKLAVWDKIFGTLIKSKEVDHLEVGLGNENPKYDSFWKNLYQPFMSLFRR